MKKLCVVIHTCDKYDFCWEGWNYYFQKNWDHAGLDVYFLNENVDVDYANVKQFKSGTGEWSDRLIKFLTSVEYEHILYMQEDMWLLENIDVQKYYSDFLKYDMNALRLLNNIGGDNIHYRFQDFDDEALLKFAANSTYLLSHQPSIWKKQYFLECLLPNENPWDNEMNGTIRIWGKPEDPKIYAVRNLPTWYTPVSAKGKLTNEGLTLLEKTKI